MTMNLLQNEIFLGILVFTVAVNAMVFLILGARRVLVSTGDVQILMNEDMDKSVVVPAGGKLLQTLATQSLFLSSACGGGGTCAQCKCQVISGGGSILPHEEAHFTIKKRKRVGACHAKYQLKTTWRLSYPMKFLELRNGNVKWFLT